MLYVSRRDGTVRRFDLRTEEGRLGCDAELAVVGEVSGVALGMGDRRADLPRPRRLRILAYAGECIRDEGGDPLAERVRVVCDGVSISLTMHLTGRRGRFSVAVDRVGTPRFRPGS